MKKMKLVIVGVVVVIVISGVTAWLGINHYAKGKYDKMKSMLSPYEKVQINDETTAILTKAKNEWKMAYSDIGGPHTDALKLLGLEPSVSNLLYVFTYSLPQYSYLAPQQNAKAALMCSIQERIFPITIDQSIHVSQDEKLAMFRCNEKTILVFLDEGKGLREEMYHVKKEDIK
ncbi:MAG: hypothetical protein GC164_13965 [Phycisphaera sp.]|nr:hypothetical protein [Phycisphaera sp.]